MKDSAERRRPVVLSSVDLVYQETRSAIVSGEYAPGTVLKIQDLAVANSVSLTPVREALRLLAAEGFVDAVRNRSARVAQVSKAEAVEIYSLRSVLETEALREAFPRITPALLSKVRQLNEELMHSDQSQDQFYENHRSLHFAIYDLSNSKWLKRLIEVLWAHSERHRWLACLPGAKPTEERAHHTELLAALERHDLDAAVASLKHHIEHNLMKLLEGGGDESSIRAGAS